MKVLHVLKQSGVSGGLSYVFTGENVVWHMDMKLLINEALSGLHVPFVTQQYVLF